MLDADGTVVGWTDTAQRLVGYAAGEVVGRSVSVVLPFAQNALRSGSSRSSAVPGVAGPASPRSATATATRTMSACGSRSCGARAERSAGSSAGPT
ncbi:PAS domain-containing protein [Streptomyces chiangmaiensis]